MNCCNDAFLIIEKNINNYQVHYRVIDKNKIDVHWSDSKRRRKKMKTFERKKIYELRIDDNGDISMACAPHIKMKWVKNGIIANIDSELCKLTHIYVHIINRLKIEYLIFTGKSLKGDKTCYEKKILPSKN